MNVTRLKWLALLLVFYHLPQLINHFHANTVREHLASARVYWTADRAIITVTTTSEACRESWVAHVLRLGALKLKVASAQPVDRVGAAHIFVCQNATCEDAKLESIGFLQDLPLWPYGGKFYTWDWRQRVFQWNGTTLAVVPFARASELYNAFPGEPNNFSPANGSRPYDVIQDVVSREEWHAYQDLASLPSGSRVSFPVNGMAEEIVVQRDRAQEASLSLVAGGKTIPLWQAQSDPRFVKDAEIARYMMALPVGPSFGRRVSTNNPFEAAAGVIIWIVLLGIFLKPIFFTFTKATMKYADADPKDFPKLDRNLWDDRCQRMEALGFVFVRDMKLSEALMSNIQRLYLHPQSRCYGAVFQVFSKGAPGLSIWFSSYLGEDWTIGHGDTKPSSGNVMTRTSHKLSFNRPGGSLEDIYTEHIATRDRIAQELGLNIVTPSGFETYEERSNLEAAARHKLLKKSISLLIPVKVLMARVKPLPNDWLGDYPKEVESRTGLKLSGSSV
jgi:hypothetical protein